MVGGVFTFLLSFDSFLLLFWSNIIWFISSLLFGTESFPTKLMSVWLGFLVALCSGHHVVLLGHEAGPTGLHLSERGTHNITTSWKLVEHEELLLPNSKAEVRRLLQRLSKKPHFSRHCHGATPTLPRKLIFPPKFSRNIHPPQPPSRLPPTLPLRRIPIRFHRMHRRLRLLHAYALHLLRTVTLPPPEPGHLLFPHFLSLQFLLILILIFLFFFSRVREAQVDSEAPRRVELYSSGVFHAPEAFEVDYEKMERELKVFVYPDGDPETYFHTPRKLTGKYASEGYFFKNIRESRFFTTDPHQAHLFFIPISCHKMRGKVCLNFTSKMVNKEIGIS